MAQFPSDLEIGRRNNNKNLAHLRARQQTTPTSWHIRCSWFSKYCFTCSSCSQPLPDNANVHGPIP